MILLGLGTQLLLELIFDLILACHELLNLTFHHQRLAGKLLFQLLDLVDLIVGAGLFAEACMARVFCISKIIEKSVSCVDCLINLLLLC